MAISSSRRRDPSRRYFQASDDAAPRRDRRLSIDDLGGEETHGEDPREMNERSCKATPAKCLPRRRTLSLASNRSPPN